MSTQQNNDSQFLAYRYARMKNSPNNWLFWIALSGAINGFFVQSSQTSVMHMAMVLPGLLAGAIPHFVMAALLAGLAVAGRYKWPLLTYVGLGMYALDTLYVLVNNMQSEILMHSIVLAFVAFTMWRTRVLAQQLAELPPIPDPFPK